MIKEIPISPEQCFGINKERVDQVVNSSISAVNHILSNNISHLKKSVDIAQSHFPQQEDLKEYILSLYLQRGWKIDVVGTLFRFSAIAKQPKL